MNVVLFPLFAISCFCAFRRSGARLTCPTNPTKDSSNHQTDVCLALEWVENILMLEFQTKPNAVLRVRTRKYPGKMCLFCYKSHEFRRHLHNNNNWLQLTEQTLILITSFATKERTCEIRNCCTVIKYRILSNHIIE